MNATKFAVVYAALRAAHDVGDHIAQTDKQSQLKSVEDPSVWMPAMAGHVVSYTALQVATLAAVNQKFGLKLSPSRMAVAVAFSAATHTILDRRWPVIKIMKMTGSPNFASFTFRIKPGSPHTPIPLHGPYLVDQTAHHAVLFCCALIMAG